MTNCDNYQQMWIFWDNCDELWQYWPYCLSRIESDILSVMLTLNSKMADDDDDEEEGEKGLIDLLRRR